MNNDKETVSQLPAFVESVTGEVDDQYWKPQTIKEWSEVTKTKAFLGVWVAQQDQERRLRKALGIWIFVLITLQVLGVFVVIVLDAISIISLNLTITKIVIPSVLGEVFGMGFVVVKYLFRPSLINPFEVKK